MLVRRVELVRDPPLSSRRSAPLTAQSGSSPSLASLASPKRPPGSASQTLWVPSIRLRPPSFNSATEPSPATFSQLHLIDHPLRPRSEPLLSTRHSRPSLSSDHTIVARPSTHLRSGTRDRPSQFREASLSIATFPECRSGDLEVGSRG